jgi:hypothetical protein
LSVRIVIKPMIYDLIIQLAFITGVATIVIIIARAIPRVDSAAASGVAERMVDRVLSKIPLAAIDEISSNFFEKTLRKIRVMVLRIENMVTAWIHYFQDGNNKRTSAAQEKKENLFEK